jgi:hypothetical protein
MNMSIKNKETKQRSRWEIFKESLRLGSVELRKTSRDLSNKSLVFAGFTLTALIFVAGFYKENLTQVSGIITLFLIGFVLFLISAEITRNAAFGWEYFVGEILYLVATAFIMGVLIMFFKSTIESFMQNLSIIMILAYIAFLSVYIINSVYSLTRESG